MRDVDDVEDLRPRGRIRPLHLRRAQPAAEEDADLEVLPLRAHEEVAGRAREHDRFVGRIDALIAEIGGSLAQPLPRVLQVLRQVGGQRRLGGRPAVVRFACLDPLLAVIALVASHHSILYSPRPRLYDVRRPSAQEVLCPHLPSVPGVCGGFDAVLAAVHAGPGSRVSRRPRTGRRAVNAAGGGGGAAVCGVRSARIIATLPAITTADAISAVVSGSPPHAAPRGTAISGLT